MERRDAPPEERAAAQAYDEELHRVQVMMAQKEYAWEQEHKTEERWQEAWQDLSPTTPYDPQNDDHRARRTDWEESMEDERDNAVWKQLRDGGVLSEDVYTHYFRGMEQFYLRDNHPDTERYPYTLAEHAAQHVAELVYNRVYTAMRQIAYEEAIERVQSWLPDAERQYDEGVRSSQIPAPLGGDRNVGIVSQAMEEGVVLRATGWNWLSAHERHQNPQLADLAWMEAQTVMKVSTLPELALQEQRHKVEQAIYGHQREQGAAPTHEVQPAHGGDSGQAPTGRAEPPPHAREEARERTPAITREQPERSPDMAARGWGQSWDEQQQDLRRAR